MLQLLALAIIIGILYSFRVEIQHILGQLLLYAAYGFGVILTIYVLVETVGLYQAYARKRSEKNLEIEETKAFELKKLQEEEAKITVQIKAKYFDDQYHAYSAKAKAWVLAEFEKIDIMYPISKMELAELFVNTFFRKPPFNENAATEDTFINLLKEYQDVFVELSQIDIMQAADMQNARNFMKTFEMRNNPHFNDNAIDRYIVDQFPIIDYAGESLVDPNANIRIARFKAEFVRIASGDIWIGMSDWQLFSALGAPDDHEDRNTKKIERRIDKFIKTSRTYALKITVEDDEVIKISFDNKEFDSLDGAKLAEML